MQGFLIDLFASNTLGQAGPLAAQKLTARELLDRGAQRLDGALAAQPASQLEVTKVLASIYGELVMPEAQLLLRHSPSVVGQSPASALRFFLALESIGEAQSPIGCLRASRRNRMEGGGVPSQHRTH